VVPLSVPTVPCVLPQGVVVGTDLPSLFMTGDLVLGAMRLEAVCPPGCVMVSSNVVKDTGEERPRVPQGVDI